jgi:hypothetical protein
MTNQEKSELVIARILSYLVDRGIREVTLDFEKLELEPSFEDFFAPCLRWLQDEGLIRWAGVKMDSPVPMRFGGHVLTARGYFILGHALTVDGRDLTAAEVIKARSAGSTSQTGLGDFLGGVLGGFTKSMGS